MGDPDQILVCVILNAMYFLKIHHTFFSTQFEKWRQAKGVGGLPLCGNFRPTQPLNGREVFHFTPAAAPPAPTGGPTGGPTPTKKVTTGAPSPTAGATTGAPPTTGAPGTTAPAAPPPI